MKLINLEDYFNDNFIEGNRYDLVNRLAGSCAVLKVPLEECLKFYRKFKHLDDEDREKLIERTYCKYEEGVMLQTLKNYNVDVYGYFKKSIITKENKKNILDNITFNYKEEKIIIDLDEVSKPVDKLKDLKYFLYLKSRNIEDRYIFKYCRVGIGKYVNRVVFPVYNKNNKCIFFTARAIKKDMVPKYLNSTSRKGNVIWNYYNVNYNKPVILTEGIIDGITAMQYLNIQAISTLSKNITKQQIEMLSLFPVIYLMFDGDVSKKYLNSLKNKINTKVVVVNIPKNKDVNGLTKEELIDIFNNTIKNYKGELDARILF